MVEVYVPEIKIKQYTSKYRDKVRSIVVENLERFYPGIDRWLEKELDKLDNGMDACWVVTNGKDSVVGVAITGLEREDDKVAKLKTFYLSKEFSGFAIGVPLLKGVLNYWMEKKIRNIFVTFAEEELDELKGFFDKFGFLMDGMRPHYYRSGKTEYCMSKTFFYGDISESNFEDFVRDYVLRMRGIIPISEGSDFLAHEDSKLSKTPINVYVKIVKDKEMDGKQLFKQMESKIEEIKSFYGIIVSYYPLMDIAENEKIKVIDGYLLENMFFPMRLKRDSYSGLVLPIYEHFANQLLQMNEPQRKIARKRLALTHEKAYYTGKDNFEGVTRGGTFLFYLTGGRQHGGVIGEAKIKILDRKGIKDATKEYVHRGVIPEDELKYFSKSGKVSIFLLTHVKMYPKKVSLGDLRNIIPSFNTICQPLTDEQIDKIRELGGNDLNSY